ncbi:hypothetical protein NMG60_11035251 [Bertholletia excelsa]
MGILPCPSPGEGSVICMIAIAIVLIFSGIKEAILSPLRRFGTHNSWEEYTVESPSDLYVNRRSPSKKHMKELRKKMKALGSNGFCHIDWNKQECSVCLTEFEPEAKLDHLPCGHVFHKTCLEKWFKCWNVTCPLCRTRMVPEEENTAPM